MTFLNRIIDNINYLSCPEIKTAAGFIIYKGKNKPVNHYKSYRQVRVTPYLGRLLDEYLRPITQAASRPSQSQNQYGFTEGMSYLLAALQRHEVQKFCLDTKKTVFTCTLDGDSAFEVVDRDILKRELFFSGEQGEYWQASRLLRIN